MRLLPSLVAACAAAGCASPPPPVSPAAALPPAPAAPDPGARCAVWEREVGFARSVGEHDARSFAEHVLPGAVFVDGGDKLLHGRAEITRGWEAILRGEHLRFGWYPTTVEITGDPHVALSRGPFWMEIRKPDAPPRFVTGTFHSIWVRDVDGVWRVTVDGGGPDPSTVTEADVEKVRAAQPAECPFPR